MLGIGEARDSKALIFGLLGLAVFINFFGLPRSAPLVGGLVLTLMTLPTIIIASRAALKSVPPSIREAALGMGASKMQTITHHVLPLAMPGMFTGTIIGMAQALGESAPLLMIGMVAFIVDVPGGPLDPSTVLPVQIFLWADSPERAFVERTSAAIMVLLAFLITMHALAVIPEVSPEVILMDEPCSSLDPIATARIARMTIDIYSSDSPPPDARLLSDAFRMSTLATRMLHDVLDALARLDVDKAIQVARGDIELDSEFQAALRRLSTYIMEDARNVGHTINVTFIVKSLERIGDHAKNIAEYVVFLVKGKDVRHVSPGSIDTEELDR